jgi:hypothetical protein
MDYNTPIKLDEWNKINQATTNDAKNNNNHE